MSTFVRCVGILLVFAFIVSCFVGNAHSDMFIEGLLFMIWAEVMDGAKA